MIGDIRNCTSDKTLTVYTNGGSNNFTQIAHFKFLPIDVHLNSDSMANNIDIKDFASIPGVHISMDSRNEIAVIVEYHNQIIKFQECCNGLYYYETANKFTSHINCYSFLNTAKYNNE